MAFNGSGTYELTTGVPVVINSAISSTVYNTLMTDIETAMNNLWLVDGDGGTDGNMPFNGNKLILDTDKDTSVRASEADVMTWECGGTDVLKITKTQLLPQNAFFGLGTDATLTISSGAITVANNYNEIDTEGAAGSDDLSSIAATAQYSGLYVLGAKFATRSVVVKDGDLKMAGDFTMDNNEDRIVFVQYSGGFYEVSRSNNGA